MTEHCENMQQAQKKINCRITKHFLIDSGQKHLERYWISVSWRRENVKQKPRYTEETAKTFFKAESKMN